MCFCTKVRLYGVSRISIVLFCLCGMESIYFKPCNIILSRCNDNTKGYLGSLIRLNVCQCGSSVQNISCIYCVQIMWRLIREIEYWCIERTQVYMNFITLATQNHWNCLKQSSYELWMSNITKLMNSEFSKLSKKLLNDIERHYWKTSTRPNKFSFEKQKSVSRQNTF